MSAEDQLLESLGRLVLLLGIEVLGDVSRDAAVHILFLRSSCFPRTMTFMIFLERVEGELETIVWEIAWHEG